MSFVFVTAAVIFLDQLSKAWILSSFQLYESREVISGLFNLVYVTNTGAAFSMLADVDSPWKHYFFLGIGSVAIVGLTIGWFKLSKENYLYTIALALIAGGAAGNLIDRVRFGSVVDFLDFYFGNYHWPAFNIADSAIFIGAGLFLIVNVYESRKVSREV